MEDLSYNQEPVDPQQIELEAAGGQNENDPGCSDSERRERMYH